MGALIAVLDKKGKDATKTALTMLKALTLRKSDAFGLASPSTVRIEKTTGAFQNLAMNSPIIVGQVFSKILAQDKPQPMTLENATLVFEGRIYPTAERMPFVEVFTGRLRSYEAPSKLFIRKTEGSFVFAIAEPEKLLAGRDSMGVQPLHYGENTDCAALASERKALWKIGIKTASSFPPGNVAAIEEQGFKFKPVKSLAYSKPEQITLQAAAEKLQTFLRRAVRERVVGLKEVVVAFSGGLDSSLIAYLGKQTGADVHLVHVSLENQSETEHARRAAEELKLPLHVRLYKETDVEKTLPEVLWLIEEPDPLKTSIGIPFYWTAENTAKMNINVLLAGQGADELFGGYKRYVDEYVKHGDEKLRNTFFNDIVKLHETNLERDSKICAFQGVELRLPFIAWSIAEFALKLPTELKIGLKNKENRKLILRHVAKNIGLSRLIVDKPKKALQYTTGVSKALERIARKEGLSLRDHLEKTFQTTLRKDCENE